MKLELVLKGHYDSFKEKVKDFIDHVHQEGGETKDAFNLLVHSVNTGTELTPQEKHQIGEQMKDVFKTIGLIGIAVLPGGTVIFLLTSYFKLNKYILPSSFEKPVIEDKPKI